MSLKHWIQKIASWPSDVAELEDCQRRLEAVRESRDRWRVIAEQHRQTIEDLLPAKEPE